MGQLYHVALDSWFWKAGNNSTELGSRLMSKPDIKSFVPHSCKNEYLYTDVFSV